MNDPKPTRTPLKHVLKPKEAHFCRLRAEGYSIVESWRTAFNKTKLPPENCTEQAYRCARLPQCATMVRELFASAKKSQLLSHADWLDRMIQAYDKAISDGNLTAAASFGRLMGAGIGSLSETLRLEDDRMTDEQLIERLGQSDPAVAQAIARLVGGKASFH